MNSRSTKNWLAAAVIAPLLVIGGIWVTKNHETSNSDSGTTTACSQSEHTPNFVSVKYRTGEVDVANPCFEPYTPLSSSFVRESWYDKSNSYMIINLSGTYYHYCGMPVSTWEDFKSADSAGTFYNGYIKGNYDCRQNYVPSYN